VAKYIYRIELCLSYANNLEFAPTNEEFNDQIDTTIGKFVDTVLTVDKLISHVHFSTEFFILFLTNNHFRTNLERTHSLLWTCELMLMTWVRDWILNPLSLMILCFRYIMNVRERRRERRKGLIIAIIICRQHKEVARKSYLVLMMQWTAFAQFLILSSGCIWRICL
jgi:hypothetical protein